MVTPTSLPSQTPPPAIINLEEAVIQVGTSADASLEALAAHNPKLFALLQQGGAVLETDFARLLFEKYPATFGQFSVPQIVSMINGLSTLPAQITTTESQITAQQNTVNTLQSDNGGIANGINLFYNDGSALAIAQANYTSDPSPANANALLLATGPISGDLAYMQQAVSAAAAYIPTSDLNEVTTLLNTISSDLSNPTAVSGDVQNLLSFLPTIQNDVSIEFGSALNTLSGLQTQLAALNAELNMFDGLDPLEQREVSELPGIVS